MATIDDLEQKSLSDMTTDELHERIKALRSARRQMSSARAARTARKPAEKKAPTPQIESLAEDMSAEALERMIAALEEKVNK